jgi:hypothetical protein
MSDTAIAFLILPFLVVLTVALECTRIGCSRVVRKLREPRTATSQMQAQD